MVRWPMQRSPSLLIPLFALATWSTAQAEDAVPAGLEAFRTHCHAPDAKLVFDTASLSPHYGSDADWPFHEDAVKTRTDDLLYLMGAACDPNDRMFLEWKVADRIVATKSGGGTRFERPERLVPVERFTGVREVRVVFDTRVEARKAFVAAGGDHRDWLKKVFARVDKQLLEEDMRDVMAVNGMPPAIALADGVLTIGLAPPTQLDQGMNRLLVRAVDLALAGAEAKGAAKPAKPAEPTRR